MEKNFKIHEVLDFLKKYITLPLIIYIIGFVYVQGMLSPFVNRDLNFDSILGVIPASYEFYTINGFTYVTFNLIIPIAFAIIILFALIQADSWIKRKFSFEKLIIYKKIRSQLLKHLNILLIIPLIVQLKTCLNLMSKIQTISNSNFIKTLLISNNLCYFFIVLVILILLKIKRLKFIDKYSTFTTWIVLILFLATVIYFQGVADMMANLKAITNGEKMVRGATVYIDKYNRQFMAIDTNGNFFIGIDPTNFSIDVIPTKSISSIDMWNGEFDNATYHKYDPNNPNQNINAEKKQVIAVINKFYSDSVYHPNASEFISLLTYNYYSSKFHFESPSILEKDWKLNKQFNGNNINDFEGYEYTIPTLKDKRYLAYIFEYWKDKKSTYQFQFVKENGSWKIENIQPYLFNVKLTQ